MSENAPKGRRRKVTGTASGLQHGEQVHTSGPVGTQGAQTGRPQSPQQARPGNQGYGGTRPQQRPTGQTQSSYPFGNAAQRPSGNTMQRPSGTTSQRPAGGSTQRPSGTASQRPTGNTAQRPSGSAYQTQRPSASRPTGSGSMIPPVGGSGGNSNRGGSRSGCLLPIIAAVVLLLGGGGMLSSLFGGGSDQSVSGLLNQGIQQSQTLPVQSSSSSSQSWTDQTSSVLSGAEDPMSLLSSYLSGSSSSLSSVLGGSWLSNSSNAALSGSGGVHTDSTRLNTSVAAGSREKYTQLLGNGRDVVTIMVYMCGTDLESRSGMATRDIQEMLKASFDDHVQLILYTGGCSRWANNSISSSVNQIWQVKDGHFQNLVRDDGSKAMTNPSTLSSFIQYGRKNFPANRYMLIFWDHGSGSVAGYGYDEKYSSGGSMTLAGISTALKNGGVQFDAIGFDACLMATVENALMLSEYADYMIASEETEPGVGWYYTNWLSALGQNPSMTTLELGKQIADDFVAACQQQARGQDTTLSVVDLAEVSHTVPGPLAAFSRSVTSLVKEKEYKTVSDARTLSREFAPSSKVDQVDLVDFALKMENQEGKALAEAARSAVKYNRSGSMTNAYGLSVFFPYRKLSNVDKAVNTYKQIGMDDSFSEAIRAFASVQVSGQAATGGYTSMPSIFSSGMPSVFSSGTSSSSSSSGSGDLISGLLSSFLGGDMSSMSGLGGTLDFFSGRVLSDAETIEYVQNHHLSASDFVFDAMEDGSYTLSLLPEQWALVHSIDQNVFYDDGQGYMDLGLDNVYEFENGRMVAVNDGAWMSIGNQIVSYYRLTTDTDGDQWRTTGYVPALLNDMQCQLLIVFDNEHEDGEIVGARFDYTQGETETVAKNLLPLEAGDKLQFLCDYYTYDNQYQASYTMGEPLIYSDEVKVGAMYLPDKSKALTTYRFTDLYDQVYWSQILPAV